MAAEVWYVHIQGETFGPVSTEVVSIMLRQNRLQFSDFVWTEGLARWTRLGELTQFAPYLPPYPLVPLPTAGAAAAEPDPPARPVAKAASPSKLTPPIAPALASTPVVRPSAPSPANPPASGTRAAPRAAVPLKSWIRRYPRVRLDGNATVEGFGRFETVDVSEGGVFVRSDTPIPFGTEVRFRIESREMGRPFDMTGIVIREGESEEGYPGFAIQFTRVNPAHRRAIHDYVKAHTKSVA